MTKASTRGSYHHGDLAAALVAAGLDLVREGGPGALGLRDVTRAVGVSPNAAYRHFADRSALVISVAEQALAQVGDVMRAEMARANTGDPAGTAIARLRAVGMGYVQYALDEPGLFQLAFQTPELFVEGNENGDMVPRIDAVGPDRHPFMLLLGALDAMVDAEVITSARRENAEWACWSAVHGFCDLATRGPLHPLPRAFVEDLARGVVDSAITGVVGHSFDK